jgi:hypothetical protein
MTVVLPQASTLTDDVALDLIGSAVDQRCPVRLGSWANAPDCFEAPQALLPASGRRGPPTVEGPSPGSGTRPADDLVAGAGFEPATFGL